MVFGAYVPISADVACTVKEFEPIITMPDAVVFEELYSRLHADAIVSACEKAEICAVLQGMVSDKKALINEKLTSGSRCDIRAVAKGVGQGYLALSGLLLVYLGTGQFIKTHAKGRLRELGVKAINKYGNPVILITFLPTTVVVGGTLTLFPAWCTWLPLALVGGYCAHLFGKNSVHNLKKGWWQYRAYLEKQKSELEAIEAILAK